ncbi:hypothetical protein M0802_007108 [Mischocyttarus mexicanus]|nr:hypothetical protein M0802_007108 [Mischocyttarus mexicanus]
MPVKEWFRKLQPVQLYLVVFFTVAFFIVEMVASHVTHSLTLLLNAYHMLCNIIAMLGCLVSIKYAPRERYRNVYHTRNNSHQNSMICLNDQEHDLNNSLSTKTKQSRSDRRMRNSFGWVRIDILTMLICCILLASFCFSLVVEALQTLVHIDHLDEMHHPVAVFCIGVVGIFLNIFCYIIIGGFTFNQGILLLVTNNGDVIFRRNVKLQPDVEGEQQLAEQTRRSPLAVPKIQGLRRICRDVLGCLFVMIVSILVYLTDSGVAKYLDPVFAIISSISLLVLSYPFMKESTMILLQTIPNHINIDSLKKDLLEAFPQIVDVHDFHVWQLTSQKIILTVHIIFLNPMVFANIINQITEFFIQRGITQVTIQPEFHKMKTSTDKADCLIRCHGKLCSLSQCCMREDLEDNSDTKESLKDVNVITEKSEKDVADVSPVIDFKKCKIHDSEIPKLVPPTTSGPDDREPCQSSDEDIQSKEDNVNDKSSYSISVDVNDQEHAANDSSHDTVS